MKPTELFQGLRLTVYYKYLLYLCGIILILSLFFEVKGISVSYVRHVSFWVIVVALGIWWFDKFMGFVNQAVHSYYLKNSDHKEMEDYYVKANWLGGINHFVQLIVWIITFVILL